MHHDVPGVGAVPLSGHPPTQSGHASSVSQEYHWEQLPFTAKLTVTLDYFLRLSFPRGKKWVFGEANRLLAETDPTDISMRLRWPVVGFWGGIFLGMAAMLVLWAMILLTMV